MEAHATRRGDSHVSVRGEDMLGFVVLTMAVILFMSWPRRISYTRDESWRQRRRDDDGEGPDHPYRRAHPRKKKDNSWVWRPPPQ